MSVGNKKRNGKFQTICFTLTSLDIRTTNTTHCQLMLNSSMHVCQWLWYVSDVFIPCLHIYRQEFALQPVLTFSFLLASIGTLPYRLYSILPYRSFCIQHFAIYSIGLFGFICGPVPSWALLQTILEAPAAYTANSYLCICKLQYIKYIRCQQRSCMHCDVFHPIMQGCIPCIGEGPGCFFISDL